MGLKNEFTEDEKCYNLMSWLISEYDPALRNIFSTDAYVSVFQLYRENPKNSATWKFAVITLKVEQGGFSLE